MTATNPYYQASGAPSVISRGTSTTLRDEFAAIQSGFDKISTTGRNWTGIHDFSGGTLKATTATFGASGNNVATLDFVNAVATNAALPGQTGKTDYLLTTNGTTAPWTNTINVSVIKFVDGTDKTKQAQIDASGITTGTTRKIFVPDRDVTLGGFTNLIVVRSTQTWTPPAGVTKAKFTVVDGGQGGGSGSTIDYLFAGKGGNASVSIRAVNPATSYTLTIGAGGAGGATGGDVIGATGGASSVSGIGFTTLTSANGDLLVPGGASVANNASGARCAGGTLLATQLDVTASAATGIGQGGPGVPANGSSKPGAAGAIIIEY